MKHVWHYIKRFWGMASGLRIRLSMSILFGLVRVGASLMLVYCSKQLIDIATGAISGSIYFMVFLLLLCFLTDIVMGIMSSYIGAQTDIKLKNKLRHNIFEHQLYVIYDGRKSWHSGNIMSRIEEDVRVVADAIANSVTNTIVTTMHLIAAFIFLAFLNPIFAIVVSCIMPICLLGAKCYAWKMKRLTGEIRSFEADIHGVIQESMQHSLMLKALCRTEMMLERLTGMQKSLYRKVMRRTRFSLFSRTMMAIGFTGGYILTFLWGAMQLQEGLITFGVMTAFLQLVGQVQRPVVELVRILPSFIHAAASIDRIAELEAQPTETKACNMQFDGRWGMRLEDLSFSYPDSSELLYHHFNHDFTPGSRTAILGETGSGKSTLVKLMLALLKPTEGKLTIYNKEGKCYELAPATRSCFIYVPQGNTLMSGSIRDNLRLGNPDATDEEMSEALQTAVAEFVFTLPNKLETKCGEGGEGLSEGQAQRIAIARALLSQGAILLFDEFSSSLDLATERLLIERLNASYPDKTMIFITHRLEVLNKCDSTLRIN